MRGLLINNKYRDSNCNALFEQKQATDRFLVAIPQNGEYIPNDGQVTIATNSLESFTPPVNPVPLDTFFTPISFQQVADTPNLFHVILSQQTQPHCIAINPSLISTQLFSQTPINNTTATTTTTTTTTATSQPTSLLQTNQETYSSTPSDIDREVKLEILVERAKTQAEKFVAELNEIVATSLNGSHCEQEILNPQEVMEFYQTLPDDKKVRKAKRNKYRKYSLATEFEVFKKSHDNAKAKPLNRI